MNLKILELMTPSNIGGAENYVVNLSKKLAEKGVEVFIMSSVPENAKNRDLSVSDFLSKNKVPFKIIHISFKYSPIAILRIYNFIKKNNISLVHTHLSRANVAGAIAARLAGIKSVATAHGLNKKAQYKYSDYVICVSKAVRENLLSQGMDGARLKLIYNGIDAERFSPYAEGLPKRKDGAPDAAAAGSGPGVETGAEPVGEPGPVRAGEEAASVAGLPEKAPETGQEKVGKPAVPRKSAGGSGKGRKGSCCEPESKTGRTFNVGIIARLSREKGVDLFIEAARLVLGGISDARFFIAGTGILKEELIKKTRDAGIFNSVYFLGFVGDNLVSFLNELDAVVFPSLKEGLPLALLESMAMEKIVIISDAGGMPEVVEDGKNGFIVKKGDAEAIYQKLVFVYNNCCGGTGGSRDGGGISGMRAEARKTIVEKFNISGWADKTMDFFISI